MSPVIESLIHGSGPGNDNGTVHWSARYFGEFVTASRD